MITKTCGHASDCVHHQPIELVIGHQIFELSDWHFVELLPLSGVPTLQLGGWLRDPDCSRLFNTGGLRLIKHPLRLMAWSGDVPVNIEYTGYGDDRGLFMKVQWPKKERPLDITWAKRPSDELEPEDFDAQEG